MKKVNRFQRGGIVGGSPVYKCGCCGKMTRNTEGEQDVELCAFCFHCSGQENSRNDGNITDEQYKDFVLERIKEYKPTVVCSCMTEAGIKEIPAPRLQFEYLFVAYDDAKPDPKASYKTVTKREAITKFEINKKNHLTGPLTLIIWRRVKNSGAEWEIFQSVLPRRTSRRIERTPEDVAQTQSFIERSAKRRDDNRLEMARQMIVEKVSRLRDLFSKMKSDEDGISASTYNYYGEAESDLAAIVTKWTAKAPKPVKPITKPADIVKYVKRGEVVMLLFRRFMEDGYNVVSMNVENGKEKLIHISASAFTCSPEHTADIHVDEDGWITTSAYFPHNMVPAETWRSDPRGNGGRVRVILRICPEEIDWDGIAQNRA